MIRENELEIEKAKTLSSTNAVISSADISTIQSIKIKFNGHYFSTLKFLVSELT